MRIIFIRHAESTNNILSGISYDNYHDNRTADPLITEGGKSDAIALGNYLKENNLKIDKFYTSATKRTVMTTDIIQNIYDEKIPVELFVECHEFGGIYLEEKGFPGMNGEEIKSLMKNITISQEYDLSKGWWLSENKETEEAFKERVKKVFAKLKTIAAANEEDYTICIITHNLFLNAFFTILINAEFLVGNINFGFANLSLSSMTINKKKEHKIEFINMPLDNK